MIFLLLTGSLKDLKIPPVQSRDKKISLNLKNFVLPAPKPRPQPPKKPAPAPKIPSPTPKPTPKPAEKAVEEPKSVIKEKKIEERGPVIAQESEEKNETKKIVKKEPEKVQKQKVHRKTVRRIQPERQKRSSDPLANFLMGSGKPVQTKSSPVHSADKMIRMLYGKEFHSYSRQQKKFIRENLDEIYRITQNTLWRKGYPDAALRMFMQGTNVVQFYLHPNGDISGLRLKREIGYRVLDKHTIEVIKTAYKDYPRPKSRTKIIFYVTYEIH